MKITPLDAIFGIILILLLFGVWNGTAGAIKVFGQPMDLNQYYTQNIPLPLEFYLSVILGLAAIGFFWITKKWFAKLRYDFAIFKIFPEKFLTSEKEPMIAVEKSIEKLCVFAATTLILILVIGFIQTTW
ncbi:MAG: hypothetical protein V1777_02050 [Candidatus Micrarchaeota archaeon]